MTVATARPENSLIVRSDCTALLEVASPLYRDARDELALFAELEKSPEHLHTNRITPLSVWNAAASGLDAERVIASLERFSKYDVPQNVTAEIRDLMARYGSSATTGPSSSKSRGARSRPST